jgi:hypothetical protein
LQRQQAHSAVPHGSVTPLRRGRIDPGMGCAHIALSVRS